MFCRAGNKYTWDRKVQGPTSFSESTSYYTNFRCQTWNWNQGRDIGNDLRGREKELYQEWWNMIKLSLQYTLYDLTDMLMDFWFIYDILRVDSPTGLQGVPYLLGRLQKMWRIIHLFKFFTLISLHNVTCNDS